MQQGSSPPAALPNLVEMLTLGNAHFQVRNLLVETFPITVSVTGLTQKPNRCPMKGMLSLK
jgi:hypothetical protein